MNDIELIYVKKEVAAARAVFDDAVRMIGQAKELLATSEARLIELEAYTGVKSEQPPSFSDIGLEFDQFEHLIINTINSDKMSASDVWSSRDIAGLINHDHPAAKFTPQLVGKRMTKIGKYRNVRVSRGGESQRLWVVRNLFRYNDMSSREIYDEWTRQMSERYQAMYAADAGVVEITNFM